MAADQPFFEPRVDRFLLAVEAIGETPKLLARRHHDDVQAATVGLPDALIAGNQGGEHVIGQHRATPALLFADSNRQHPITTFDACFTNGLTNKSPETA